MNVLIDGLSLGAIYALIALGYTMVYGIAKMLNFAHGDIIMVGAYTIWFVINTTHNLWVAAISAVVLCCVMGIVIEKVAYKPLRSASPLAVLITAIGVSYLLQGFAQLFFKSDPKPISLPLYGTKLGNTSISLTAVFTMIISAIIMIGLTLFVKKTRTGRAMLAVSEDKGAARLMGVNVDKIIMITFAIGSALAAVASLFYLYNTPQVRPTTGAMPGIIAFSAAVIGGIGSLPGAMIGGILLGVVEKVCPAIPGIGPFTNAIEFGLLIVILLIKPVGLLGKKKREKV